MTRGMFGPGTIVLGGGAVLLVVFLAVGFFLPSEWSSGATATVPAELEVIRGLLDSPEGWQEWTTWPDSGLSRSGPERGSGAAIHWDDPELGSGSFTVQDVEDRVVRYAVEVAGAGGAVMRTQGLVALTPQSEGTLVEWEESGDLGRNPLMGYWALSMERAQGIEMAKSLERLAEATAGRSPNSEAPADSMSTGAR